MTAYRKPMPYAKAQTYRGTEVVPAVQAPSDTRGYALPWGSGMPGAAAAVGRWGEADPFAAPVAFPARDATPQDAPASAVFGALVLHDRAIAAPYTEGKAADLGVVVPFGVQAQFDREVVLPWAELKGYQRLHTARHRRASPHIRTLRSAWDELRAAGITRSAVWRALVQRGAFVALPWSPAQARSAPVRIEWPVEPPPSTGTIHIPEKAVYFMIPTLSARRLSDDAPLHLLNATLDNDGGWAWTLSAAAPYSERGLVDPVANDGPVEIEVTVNGYAWRFAVEGFDDNRRFGSNTLTLRARSRSVLLASPYRATRTWTQPDARTAAQIAADELAGTGWNVIWDAPDWLLPEGAFTYQDLAPLEAIGQLAAAVGAVVHADASADELTVAPRYPVSPWAWDAASPYAVIPASIITAGDSSWQGGTNADGIYVYPEGGGTGAFVKVTGSAGATSLPMVVDRLLVDADSQRERGRIEIAAAGRKRTASRTIPLLPPLPAPEGSDLGVVPIGALVEFDEGDETWRGQVTAVRIDASRSGSALSVRQQLSIERQYR